MGASARKNKDISSEVYEYGKVIKARRVDLGLTQRQVADHCGISDSALAHIERELRLPSDKVAENIVEALGFPREVREAFFEGLRKARELQTQERVRRRNRTDDAPILIKATTGIDGEKLDVEQLSAKIAADFISDDDLYHCYVNLRNAWSKPNQRDAVSKALAAWAGADQKKKKTA